MMKAYLFVLAFAILSFVLPGSVHASSPSFVFGGMFFGVNEKIEKLQDLEGTEYELCNKYTSNFFIGGIHLSDDGYVLRKKTDYTRYIPLTDAKIQELQQTGELPSPMPKYSIPISAYLFGYSLWIVLAVSLFWVVGIPLIYGRWRKSKGIHDCSKCGIELTPEELNAKRCYACGTPVQEG